MPFWWSRRRKFWYGRRRWATRKRRYKKKFRWPRRRRRPRRFARRRRRRRQKVRRKKKKKIVLTQWQPDRILRCKIKGMGSIVIGADGKQMLCFTNEREILTPSKTPGGGGFGVEKYTLQHLYEQWTARKNIWTKSNLYTDLCMYTGCKFTFYRHNNVDFIINYNRQPPFQLDKTTYLSTHPTQMLLGKHKKILLSKLRKPNGREKLTLRIKPPKTMINKWYFQKQFTMADLCQISATCANFSFPSIGPTNENMILNLTALNTEFYKDSDWGQQHTQAYYPFSNIERTLHYWTKKKDGSWQSVTINYTDYFKSINLSTGAFNPLVLNASHISKLDKPQPGDPGFVEAMAQLPVVPVRYNLPKDTGAGNLVWAQSILAARWSPPSKDSHLVIANTPIWLSLWGLSSYIRKHLQDYNVLRSYIFVIQSPAISRLQTASTQTIYPIISSSFLNGKNPYNTDITPKHAEYWYPTYYDQEEILNLICEAGPFVPKLERNRESTWELAYHYCFYFKWGGPEITDQQVANPTNQQTWPEPYTDTTRLQISNPLKQDTDSMLHSWDFRRGIVTQKALERMCSHLETDTDFEPDQEEPPKKKKKIGCELPCPGEDQKEIQVCLQELCKESSCQEEETGDLYQLIKQQKQQQRQLKHNLLILLKDLKLKQKDLQLQVGPLN
nr:MAG: ORF1 [Torque teno midi virus]